MSLESLGDAVAAATPATQYRHAVEDATTSTETKDTGSAPDALRPVGRQRGLRSSTCRARIGARVLASVAALQLVPTASAHAGTAHAGTPHRVLLALFLLGVLVVAASWWGLRRHDLGQRIGVAGMLAGFVLGGFGGVGLVEIQVVAASGPSPRLLRITPLVSLALGTALVLGSQAAVLLRWPDRPRYGVLGAVLGAWMLYPVLMPNDGVAHPLGYSLVVALPLVVGYVLVRDAGGPLRRVLVDRFPRRIGLATALVVGVFLAFSAGTLTLDPETGLGVPPHGFVTSLTVAEPLVLWPAVEFYAPSVPLFGMVSVGTVLLFGLLSGLLGLNVAVVAAALRGTERTLSPSFLAGALGTTGTTACCCCAPAAYGVVSAALGASATPIYWSFMDANSPLSSGFLAASVLLLTASLVRSVPAASSGAACAVPAGDGG